MNKIAQIYGQVNPPPGVKNYAFGDYRDIATFISNIIKFLIVGAGIFTVINLVLAGYSFLAAGDNPKNIENAWGKIWQSIIGLVVAAGSIVLAAIFGKLIFGDFNALLKLRVFGP